MILISFTLARANVTDSQWLEPAQTDLVLLGLFILDIDKIPLTVALLQLGQKISECKFVWALFDSLQFILGKHLDQKCVGEFMGD